MVFIDQALAPHAELRWLAGALGIGSVNPVSADSER
jgi:hypothetical protein